MPGSNQFRRAPDPDSASDPHQFDKQRFLVQSEANLSCQPVGGYHNLGIPGHSSPYFAKKSGTTDDDGNNTYGATSSAFGMTAGLDEAPTLYPSIHTNVSQPNKHHDFDVFGSMPWSLPQNNPAKILNVTDDVPLKFNVVDVDAFQNDMQQYPVAQAWHSDAIMEDNNQFSAVPHTDPHNSISYTSSSVTNASQAMPPHQMNRTTATFSPFGPVLADLENVEHAPRKASDSPWSQFTAVEYRQGLANRYSTSLDSHEALNHEGSTTEFGESDGFVSNGNDTMTSLSSFDPLFHGKRSTLQPVPRRNSVSDPRRRKSIGSNRSMPPRPHSRANGNIAASIARYVEQVSPKQSRSRSSSQRLSVPENLISLSGPASPALSNFSVTSSTAGDILACEICGCDATFTGKYRKGTLQRHCRLKHGQEEKLYLCEAFGCNNAYKRSDARVKHYRSQHPELEPSPPVPRKPDQATQSYELVDEMY